MVFWIFFFEIVCSTNFRFQIRKVAIFADAKNFGLELAFLKNYFKKIFFKPKTAQKLGIFEKENLWNNERKQSEAIKYFYRYLTDRFDILQKIWRIFQKILWILQKICGFFKKFCGFYKKFGGFYKNWAPLRKFWRNFSFLGIKGRYSGQRAILLEILGFFFLLKWCFHKNLFSPEYFEANALRFFLFLRLLCLLLPCSPSCQFFFSFCDHFYTVHECAA